MALPAHISNFLGELRRRGVGRALALYVLAAWVAIEAADTLFPHLGLPDWAIRLVIGSAITGVPIVAALSWTFDLDGGGLRRVTPAVPERTTPRLQWGWAGGLAVLLLTGGLWLGRVDWVGGTDLDLDRVAVLPLTVSGAAPELAYMSEGLLHLLAAGLRATPIEPAPPLAVLQRVRKMNLTAPYEIPEKGASAIAGDVGAGLLLQGNVVGGSGNVVVSGELREVRSGRVWARLQFAAPADSLHQLVDALVNQVAASFGGVPQHRLASVTTASPLALKEYILGERAAHGTRYREALDHFARALELDSTFALAALAYYPAAGWTRGPIPRTRAADLAWRHRDRLSDEDRQYLTALLGPHYPRPARASELLRARSEAAEMSPHRPELWMHLGEAYIHWGELVGVKDAFTLAREAFERTIELDSAYLPAVHHLLHIAARDGDTASVRRRAEVLERRDSANSPTVLEAQWVRASLGMASEDSVSVIEEISPGQLSTTLVWTAAFTGVGLARLGVMLRRGRPDSAAPLTPQERAHIARVAVLEGRPSELLGAWSGPDVDRSQRLWWEYVARAVWLHDEPGAGVALRQLQQVRESESFRDRSPLSRAYVLCAITHARLALQQPGAMEEDLAALAAAADELRPADAEVIRLWERLVRVSNSFRRNPAVSLDALATLDAELRSGPRAAAGLLVEIMNMMVADLWEQAGDLERALAAQRRVDNLATFFYVDRLAEQGRLAEQLGLLEEARQAYARYLRYRTRPEPPFDREREAVRSRLRALVGEPAGS